MMNSQNHSRKPWSGPEPRAPLPPPVVANLEGVRLETPEAAKNFEAPRGGGGSCKAPVAPGGGFGDAGR